MKYKTKFLGPLFVGTGGLIVALGTNTISLNQMFNGVSAISLLTLTVMAYSWADM